MPIKAIMTNTFRFAARAIAIALAFASLSPIPVQAQGRERERERNPHWVLDQRYHHNHYYPAPGYSVTILPTGNIGVTFGGGRFFYHSGVWFRAAGPRYVVVRPPIGVVVPVLPPAYTTVWYGGVPYYYANDIYYVQGPGGYAVAEPPPGAAPSVAPPAQPPAPFPPQPNAAPAPQAGAGTWYFCESAKGYYPYVSECKEGWKTVPAAPPPGR